MLKLPAFLLCLMLGTAACKPLPSSTVIVVVHPAQGRCGIWSEDKEQEQPVDCRQLGSYLRDTLKVSADRDISVSLTGAEDVPKEDTSIDIIAAQIRTAGYKKVRTARFAM
jgi:hypothetical protein